MALAAAQIVIAQLAAQRIAAALAEDHIAQLRAQNPFAAIGAGLAQGQGGGVPFRRVIGRAIIMLYRFDIDRAQLRCRARAFVGHDGQRAQRRAVLNAGVAGKRVLEAQRMADLV